VRWRAFREFLAREAVLRVALPINVEGKLHKRAEALFTIAERALGIPPPAAEFAQ
jgi:hypothetical protein